MNFAPITDLFGGLSLTCERCGGYVGASSPDIPYDGDGKNRVLVITEYPSAGDDRNNGVLTGSQGTFLEKKFRMHGWDLFRDCWVTHAVRCRPNHKKGVPTKKQIDHCRMKVIEEIDTLKPDAIIVLGSISLGAIADGAIDANIYSYSGVQMWHGDIPVYPLFNPLTMLKSKHDANLHGYFDVTMKKILRGCLNPPKKYNTNYIERIKPCLKFDQIEELFEDIIPWAIKDNLSIAFDYEGTGLNPYIPGHVTTSMALAVETENSYPFPVDTDFNHWRKSEREKLEEYIKYFLECDAYKVAHNAMFEAKWSSQIHGVHPWIDWDTMVIQHAIDPVRKGITGLKKQAFVRWGIRDYAEDSKPYIEAKDGEHFNRMREFPIPKQMMYVGSDALLTSELFIEQQSEIKPEAAEFFNESVRTMSIMSSNGYLVDREFYAKQLSELAKMEKDALEEIYESQEYIGYCNKTGAELNLGSNTELQKFLYDHLKLGDPKGDRSCDAKALGDMGHWICDKIIEFRKPRKQQDTINSILEYTAADDYVRSEFLLHRARSLRSSSKNPNAQNWSKREEAAKNRVRGGIIAPDDYRIIEVDFSGAEVNTSAAYHRDPNFINYQMDPNSDMHRDGSADIWCCDPEEVSKKVRGTVKNSWTFPQFYGDWYKACANALWENKGLKLDNGLTCEANLKKSGIKNFNEFVEHLKKAEDILWHKRFKVYTEWKDKTREQYQADGYVDTFFGFRYQGYLDKKQSTNYQIQGTSFHVLLWCLNRIQEEIDNRGMLSRLVGQIHDSAVSYVHKSETHEFLTMVKHICEVEVNEEFGWVVVPYKVDVEYSKIGGRFSEMYEIEDWDEFVETGILTEKKAA